MAASIAFTSSKLSSLPTSAAGCETESASSSYTFTSSVLGTNNQATMSIFPNPASTQVTISQVPVGATFKMIDLTGKVIMTAVVNNSTQLLDVSHLSNAMYFIQVENEGVVTTQKVIINK